MKTPNSIGIEFPYFSDEVDAIDIAETVSEPEGSVEPNTSEQSRKDVIAQFIIDQNHFGLDADIDGLTAWISDTLAALEFDKRHFDADFDITAIPADILTPILQERRIIFEQHQIAAENERRQELLDTYLTAFDGRPIAEIFSALAANDQIPEAVQLKAVAFAQMMSPDIIKTKTDREAVAVKINAYTLATIPLPTWFVLSEILSDEDLSEKTRKAVAKEFDIDLASTSGKTLMAALAAKNEDGDFVHPEANPIALGAETVVFVDENDACIVRVGTEETGNSYECVIESDESPDDIGLKLSLLKIWAANSGAYFFGEDISPYSDFILNASDSDLGRMRAIIANALGNNYQGEILTEELVDFLITFEAFITDAEHVAYFGVYDEEDYVINAERYAAIALFLRSQGDASSWTPATVREHLSLLMPGAIAEETSTEESDDTAKNIGTEEEPSERAIAA